MHILFTFLYKTSLQILNQAGFLTREIIIPLELSEQNLKFSFLTYGNENDLTFSKVLKGINIIPVYDFIKSKNRWVSLLKSFFIPLKFKHIFQLTDIIRTDQLEGSWIATIAKIIFRKKLIIRGGFEWLKFHILENASSSKQSFLKYWFNYFKIYVIEFFAYKLADRIILTNLDDIEFIIEKFRLNNRRNKINHFYNFVDINRFRPLNLEKLDKHILFIGRFNKQKNLVNLIKAFKNLEGFTLDLIGQGQDQLALTELAEKCKISYNFLGVIPHNKLPELLNKYQIFILPSYYEGNPKVLLEAMSCGLACIGTNVWGIKNIIKHYKNGILCNTSSESIKNAILNLYNNKTLRNEIGNKARDFIIKNCSLDTILKKELSLYKSFSSQK